MKYQIQFKSNPKIGSNCKKENGGNQPPKKNKTFRLHNKTILRYSPRKKKANGNAECSVLYPETSSDSASGKSKGVRFVSAKLQIKNIINIGHNGQKYQTSVCAFTI